MHGQPALTRLLAPLRAVAPRAACLRKHQHQAATEGHACKKLSLEGIARDLPAVISAVHGVWLVGAILSELRLEETEPILGAMNSAAAIAASLHQPEGPQLLHTAAHLERQLRAQRKRQVGLLCRLPVRRHVPVARCSSVLRAVLRKSHQRADVQYIKDRCLVHQAIITARGAALMPAPRMALSERGLPAQCGHREMGSNKQI